MFAWRGRISSTWRRRPYLRASRASSITSTRMPSARAVNWWKPWRLLRRHRRRVNPPTAQAESAQPTPEQTIVIADLHWLIHQGHVIEFANGILETAKRPLPKPEPKPAAKPAAPPAAAAPSAEEAAVSEAAAPEAIVESAPAPATDSPQPESTPTPEQAPAAANEPTAPDAPVSETPPAATSQPSVEPSAAPVESPT